MKKISLFFLLSYFLFGTFFLPLGNFSSLVDLPNMYAQCKSTEDKDMTIFDFVTDHLVDVDFIFDQHENEDEQKPHTPIQFQHLQLQTIFWQATIELSLAKPAEIKTPQASIPRRLIPSEYISKIFRPPIV